MGNINALGKVNILAILRNIGKIVNVDKIPSTYG
jgi:hypothetical protein